MTIRRPTLGAIFLTVFLDLLGFGLVMPFLAAEARDTFHTAPLTATLLGSVYSLMQFLFVPVWGRLSDRIGRRPILVWSIAGTALSMAGLGLGLSFGHTVLWLFLARAFSGIATANLGTASAYIADITSPQDRAKGMGMIGMAFGLGFVFGPPIGGALATIRFLGHEGTVPCFVAAALSVCNFIWVAAGLPESLPPEKRGTAHRSLSPLNLRAMKEAFTLPGVTLAVLVNFLVIVAFTNLDQTFTFFLQDKFGLAKDWTGYTLGFVGIVAALVQGGLVRRLAKKHPESKLIQLGVLLQVFAFVGVALSPAFGKVALFGACALLAIGNGITQPSTSAFVSKRAPANAQGATLSTNQSFAALARSFGPALGGFLYGIAPTAPYLAAAAGMALAFLAALGLRAAYDTVAATDRTAPAV